MRKKQRVKRQNRRLSALSNRLKTFNWRPLTRLSVFNKLLRIKPTSSDSK